MSSSSPSDPAASSDAVGSASAVELDARFSSEEYLIWKKNSPYLYDLLVSHSLEWPSLTVEWFPDRVAPEGKDYTIQRLLAGTHSNEGNSVIIIEVRLPGTEDDGEALITDQSGEEANVGGYGKSIILIPA